MFFNTKTLTNTTELAVVGGGLDIITGVPRLQAFQGMRLACTGLQAVNMTGLASTIQQVHLLNQARNGLTMAIQL